MKHNFLTMRNFLVREDFSSLLLYYDYFSIQTYIITKPFTNPYLRRLKYHVIRIILIFLYISKLYKFKYPIVPLEEDAVIIFKGNGEWRNTIKLIERDGKLIIVKKTLKKETYIKEKNFYELYKNNNTHIKFPNHTFLEDNTIEIDFLRVKSFERLVVDGSFSFDMSMSHFYRLKKELEKLYKKNPTFIHGDMWLTNIFIDKDIYYFIDFSDSLVNDFHYDLYTLLSSILSTYHYVNINQTLKETQSINGKNVIDILGIDKLTFGKFQDYLQKYRKKRFIL